MNNNEKFYAEVKSLYAYLYEWKESLEMTTILCMMCFKV